MYVLWGKRAYVSIATLGLSYLVTWFLTLLIEMGWMGFRGPWISLAIVTIYLNLYWLMPCQFRRLLLAG